MSTYGLDPGITILNAMRPQERSLQKSFGDCGRQEIEQGAAQTTPETTSARVQLSPALIFRSRSAMNSLTISCACLANSRSTLGSSRRNCATARAASIAST